MHSLVSIGRRNPPVSEISRVGDEIAFGLSVCGLGNVIFISSMGRTKSTYVLGRAEIVLGAHLAVQSRSLLIWSPHLQLFLNLNSYHPLVGRLYLFAPLLSRSRILGAHRLLGFHLEAAKHLVVWVLTATVMVNGSVGDPQGRLLKMRGLVFLLFSYHLNRSQTREQ